jgi:rubredoxin
MMNAEEKISWLNQHTGWRKWRGGDSVRCRLCGWVFKAEHTISDDVGAPTCPHCIASTAADFEKVK